MKGIQIFAHFVEIKVVELCFKCEIAVSCDSLPH